MYQNTLNTQHTKTLNLKLETLNYLAMNTQTEKFEIQTAANKLTRTSFPTKAFIKLEAWKKCIEIKSIFNVEIIPSLPQDKQDSLGKLIRNASTSISTDYLPYDKKASGRHEKIDYQKDAQFIRTVRFSLSQLKNYITTCSDFNYIDTAVYNKGTLLIENTKALLNRYIYFLSR